MSDLKPCPFCGCTTIKRVEHINGVVHHCDWCGVEGPMEGVFDGVEQGWNIRAVAPAIDVKGLVEVMRKTLDAIEWYNQPDEDGLYWDGANAGLIAQEIVSARATLAEIKLQSSEFATQKRESHE